MKNIISQYRKEREKHGLINSKLCAQKELMSLTEERLKRNIQPIITEMYRVESGSEYFSYLLKISEKSILEPTEIDYSSIRIKNEFVYVRYNYYHRYSCGDSDDVWLDIRFPISYLSMTHSQIRTEHHKFMKDRINRKLRDMKISLLI